MCTCSHSTAKVTKLLRNPAQNGNNNSSQTSNVEGIQKIFLKITPQNQNQDSKPPRKPEGEWD